MLYFVSFLKAVLSGGSYALDFKDLTELHRGRVHVFAAGLLRREVERYRLRLLARQSVVVGAGLTLARLGAAWPGYHRVLAILDKQLLLVEILLSDVEYC